MNSRFLTPLRYPGGKSKFAPFISNLMSMNGLVGGHYLEPYAGGAAVALELLYTNHASHIHINDLDPALYDFWSTVTQQPEKILKLLADTPISMEQWFHWRSVLRGEIQANQVERGFATLYLNRTNRSGILKAGVIGGLKQNGTYKLDARFKKEAIAKRIEKIALHAGRITVHNKDAYALLQESHTFLPENSLIYLDPPYYVKGKGLYRNFYHHEDHQEIANLLQSPDFNLPWVVSYDNVQEIEKMYHLSKALSYGLSYTAQKKYIGSEIMFFSQNLKVQVSSIPCSFKSA